MVVGTGASGCLGGLGQAVGGGGPMNEIDPTFPYDALVALRLEG
jgi:hypothetical protein